MSIGGTTCVGCARRRTIRVRTGRRRRCGTDRRGWIPRRDRPRAIPTTILAVVGVVPPRCYHHQGRRRHRAVAASSTTGGGGGTRTVDLPRRRGMLPGTEEGNIDEITIMQHCYRRRVVREGGDDAAQRRRHSSSARSPRRRGCWRLVHRARTTWPGGAR